MQTINPAAHQLFCKPDEAETTTRSGFFIAEKSAERPRTAIVVNVGSAVQGYKANDRIVYKSYSTTELKLNGEAFLLVTDEDVLGTVLEVAE